jgi:hypothetical protein
MAGIAGVLICAAGLMAQKHDMQTWSGLMVDGGCRDRSPENLRTPPTDSLAVAAKEPAKPPKGITVAPQVLKAERGEATLPDTLDHASRYDSASCALTADTKAFAILLADGQLLDLDEGGNTLAFDAFQSTPAGAAILNGKVGGLKPQATVTGLTAGRRIKVQSVVFVRPTR